MEQARLFWAVNLPAELKAKLALLQSRLQEVPADVKWVEQHNLHLTVKFMGGVEREKINDLVQAVEQGVAGTGPISLELTGVGFFPGARRPRVAWVGLQGEINKLRRLRHMVDQSLAGFGFPPESKRFSPHLTIGRVRSAGNAGDLVPRLELAAREFGSFGKIDVTIMELMESVLTRRGPVYSVVAGVKLTR